MPPLRMWKILVRFAIFMWILVLVLGFYRYYYPKFFKTDIGEPIHKNLHNKKTAHNYSPRDNHKLLIQKDRNYFKLQSDASRILYVGSKSESKKSVKMWFMNEGNFRPEKMKSHDHLKLWPDEADRDRIVDQLMYLPEDYKTEYEVSLPGGRVTRIQSILKYILLVGDFGDYAMGRRIFIRDKCPVNTCSLLGKLDLSDSDEQYNPDAVIFKDKYVEEIYEYVERTEDQIWILYLLESPVNIGVRSWVDIFNWTASYRQDSDIVTPYDKFLRYDVARLYAPTEIKKPEESRNFAEGKTKKVAWVVSNCNTENRRMEYAEYLELFIQVDVYGLCGTKTCPQGKGCFEMLGRHYKFYLSFENSNCKDYITEKFYNALRHNMLPIVMGPPREDYEKVAPPHSFIHVDDFNSEGELADYLKSLDQNDTLYNSYFEWRSEGEFVNTYFWCRLCAMLHAPTQYDYYADMKEWFSGPGVCRA